MQEELTNSENRYRKILALHQVTEVLSVSCQQNIRVDSHCCSVNRSVFGM